jgi:hypothetical protein
MIIIYGKTTCVGLEENLDRFLNVMQWSQEHSCFMKGKKKVIIDVKSCGKLYEVDKHLGEIELCDIYDFHALCKSCMKSKKYLYVHKDE